MIDNAEIELSGCCPRTELKFMISISAGGSTHGSLLFKTKQKINFTRHCKHRRKNQPSQGCLFFIKHEFRLVGRLNEDFLCHAYTSII